jgi:hypothetical protein
LGRKGGPEGAGQEQGLEQVDTVHVGPQLMGVNPINLTLAASRTCPRVGV